MADLSLPSLQHLNSYPAVSEVQNAVKKNPHGATALAYVDAGYDGLVKPVLPYAEQPYAYVAPYVSKVDELAAHGLDTVDATFPIITKDTNTIRSTAWSYVTYPFATADGLKNWVLNTYGSEYKKCGGDGVIAGGKAVITTGLLVTSDTLNWLSKLLNEKKDEAKVVAKDTQNKIKEKTKK